MDLLIISATMYAADTRINREQFAEDNWTRQIDLYIPVSNPDLWNTQKARLEQIFRFLTGDIWKLCFRDRSDKDFKVSPVSKLTRFQMPYETNTVCLFSGGMDSFIGAIKLLESGVRPLLVGHSKSADVGPYQKNCANALKLAYPSIAPERIYAYISIPKNDLFNSEDHTERGRSFMFLSLGAICGSALNSEGSNLYVPENGMISLNIPLTPLRVGSHSTRTTHPHYLSMMQDLFDDLQLRVNIENPFQFFTKGEMIKDCANQSLILNTETMSCSHPSGRYEGKGNAHCGRCVPCIIRQSSYSAAGVSDRSLYRTDIRNGPMEIDKANGADILAFKYMIAKAKRHPAYLNAAIRITGPLGNDVDRYLGVYSRALQEVEYFLDNIELTKTAKVKA
ncbi:MAG: 7-cyano-7-deazaguanine synthase [Cyclobacteriaceae bacterium]|nr:7-cyano-7-deazaguanine synthase [Cyclobacteriaceae bacterium]